MPITTSQIRPTLRCSIMLRIKKATMLQPHHGSDVDRFTSLPYPGSGCDILSPVRIADIMALVVPPMTELFRQALAGHEDPEPMFPTLIAVRNERVVATVSTPRMSVTLNCATPMAVGLAPDALVVAAQVRVQDQPGLAYSVMTQDRRAKFVLQPVGVQDGELSFGRPTDAGTPADDRILVSLAEAIGQQPLDPATVSHRDRSGVFGETDHLPPEQGRVVLDAGALRTIQQRVKGVLGQALYVARSPEAGRLARQAGLPRECLLTADSPETQRVWAADQESAPQSSDSAEASES